MAPPSKKPHASRNAELTKGIGRHSRSKMYHKKGLWAIKAKNGDVFPTHIKCEKPEAPKEKPPKFYPAEDAPKPIKNRRKIKPTKLRASITAGTVLILLAGRFKGKRVVFLKQLESRLLFITGPFNVNGMPVRRVDQTYVIATSTKIDVSCVDVSKFNEYFKRVVEKKKKGETEFFEQEKEKEESSLPPEKKEAQKALDAQLLEQINKVPELRSYLAARFSLRAGQKPHELVF